MDLTLVPGLPECALPNDLALQGGTPVPPWDCRVRAVVWWQRAAPALPEGWPVAARGLTVGAVVDYLESPVGPYREVFAGPLARSGLALTVPFIAVDSPESVAGGREHWALPKGLAAFTGDVRQASSARGGTWAVDVAVTRLGPLLPTRLAFGADQGRGRATVSLRGRTALARVRVDAVGPTLSGWLGSGTHVGVVGEGRLLVGPPRGEPAPRP